jgi:DNA replication protein DnaC
MVAVSELAACPQCGHKTIKFDEAKGCYIKDECSCEAQFDSESWLNEQIRQRIEQRIHEMEIPGKYLDASLDDATEDQQPMANALKKWVDVGTETRWLMLSGKVGTGKTRFARAAQLECLRDDRFCRYYKAKKIESALSEKAYGERAGFGRILGTTNRLIVDEIGLEGESDSINRFLFDVLDSRYEYDRPTVLISNLTPQELSSRSPEWARIIDRLRELGGAVKLEGKSHRQKGKK